MHSASRQALRLLLDGDDRIEIVGQAVHGEEAIKLALLHLPDIVTMDIQMPVMDGIEATKQLRYLPPQVKVVLVSASEFGDRAETAAAAGVAAYVTKRRVFEELIGVIVKVAGGKNFVIAAGRWWRVRSGPRASARLSAGGGQWPKRRSGEQAEALSSPDRLDPRVGAELAECVPQMVANGRERELLSRRRPGQAGGDQVEDLALTGRESRMKLEPGGLG